MNLKYFLLATIFIVSNGSAMEFVKNYAPSKMSSPSPLVYYLHNLYTPIPFNNIEAPFEDLRLMNEKFSQTEIVYFSHNSFEKIGIIENIKNENWLDIATGNAIYWSREIEKKPNVLGIWKGDSLLYDIAKYPSGLAQIGIILKEQYLSYVRKYSFPSIKEIKNRHP